MLQASLLGFLVSQLTQRLPLPLADLANAQPRLLEHLHLLQRPAGFSELAQLRKGYGDGKLAAELDVDEAPPGFVLCGGGVIVGCAWASCAFWS